MKTLKNYYPRKHKLRGEEFIPKWKLQMPTKHHKLNGYWWPWQQPDPAKRVGQTNHERMLEQKALRDNKILMLQALVKQTKEANPSIRQSYRAWTLQAMRETKQKLYE